MLGSRLVPTCDANKMSAYVNMVTDSDPLAVLLVGFSHSQSSTLALA